MFTIRNRIGKRLFDKDVLAVAGCQNCLFGVHRIGADQMNRIDVISFEDIIIGRFMAAAKFSA